MVTRNLQEKNILNENPPMYKYERNLPFEMGEKSR